MAVVVSASEAQDLNAAASKAEPVVSSSYKSCRCFDLAPDEENPGE